MTDKTTPAAAAATPATAERGWRALYRLGAIVALVTLAGTLLDIALTMVPGWGPTTVPTTAAAWLAQLAGTPLLGMRNLDLLNITLSAIGLPMYLALFGAHRRVEPGLGLLALIAIGIGTALFIASNAALPMLELARRYASTAAGDRLALEAAAEALLARGAHGSFGAFLGFFLSEVGTLLTALVMLRGRIFTKSAGWIGIVGTAVLMAYTVGITFAPGSEMLMKGVAAPAGLLMMVWNVLVARKLLALAKTAEG